MMQDDTCMQQNISTTYPCQLQIVHPTLIIDGEKETPSTPIAWCGDGWLTEATGQRLWYRRKWGVTKMGYTTHKARLRMRKLKCKWKLAWKAINTHYTMVVWIFKTDASCTLLYGLPFLYEIVVGFSSPVINNNK